MLSAKSEYACLAMLELARRYPSGELVSARYICEQHHIPQPFLLQVMQQLKQHGLVVSTRGSAGGYRITRDPHQVSLGEVLDCLDGEKGAEQDTSNLSRCQIAIQEAYNRAEKLRDENLKRVALGDLCDCLVQSHEPIWHI